MPRAVRRALPRRGYLLFFVGLLVGALAFFAVNVLFPPSTGGGGTTGIPTRIEFEFLYTSEKQGWIQEVTPAFEVWFKAKFGIDVSVKLTVMGSEQTVNEIVRGSKPIAWSPASSIWIDYLNHKWNVAGHTGTIAQEWFPLVVSPTVICAWESFVKRYNVTNYRDLERLSQEGIPFKFGHPDPLLSNGGATTLVMIYAAATRKSPANFTIDDVMNEDITRFVKDLESHSVYYGSSTGFFGTWAVENGPTAIDAFGVYENVIIENSLEARSKWGDRLIALYPDSGFLLNDHPFVILNGDWVGYWERFAADQYRVFLLSEDSQLRAQKHGFRPVNPIVPIDTSIFSEDNGVAMKLDDSEILKPPTGDILDALLSKWVDVRAGGG